MRWPGIGGLVALAVFMAPAHAQDALSPPQQPPPGPAKSTGTPSKAVIMPAFPLQGVEPAPFNRILCQTIDQDWPHCTFEEYKDRPIPVPQRPPANSASPKQSPPQASLPSKQPVEADKGSGLRNSEVRSFHSHRVFGVSDFADLGRGLPARRFAGNADPTGRVHFFTATVTTPPGHKPGVIERPGPVWNPFSVENAGKHITLAAIAPVAVSSRAASGLDQGALAGWLHEVRADAERRRTKHALLLITGMGNALPSALHRLAQVTEDASLSAVPVACVWAAPPATPDPRTYAANLAAAERSVATCRKLLDVLLDGHFEELTIVAFSMGAHVATGTLAPLLEAAATVPPPAGKAGTKRVAPPPEPSIALSRVRKIRDIILVAADVDRVLFQDRILKPLQLLAGEAKLPRVTIYASSKDGWIERSDTLWKATRLGHGGAQIFTAPGLVSIDASSKIAGDKGHDLLGVPDVLRDIHAAVELRLAVEHKSRWLNLVRTASGGIYYELK